MACFTPASDPIQCCGHGLLSCAALWIDVWGQAGTLLNGSQQVPCELHGDRIWISLPELTLEPVCVPSWLETLLAVDVDACALAGYDTGYLVVELERGTDLAAIPAPGIALGRHTQRALVLTCEEETPAGAADTHADVLCRYFAPQYGVPEDAATGSAMRLLSTYWRQRGLGPALRARQCSVEGGLLLSESRDGRCWVGGAVIGGRRHD
ncbi:PhzF family phenazine biosynthesis protein [Biformimicrobium ophioploci]|uniref:PhzF family phenazine biosynthesis protein n=1 Tax=Biformimicrobium ophioploci TaxID=3036711 RepID=UPI002557498D|nr:PhzF family phenazine biosynthesis protein [Microbulbifer sp. NKW57]